LYGCLVSIHCFCVFVYGDTYCLLEPKMVTEMKTYPVHIGFSYTYRARKLINFTKNLKKSIHVFSILLYMCMKFQVQTHYSLSIIKKRNFCRFLNLGAYFSLLMKNHLVPPRMRLIFYMGNSQHVSLNFSNNVSVVCFGNCQNDVSFFLKKCFRIQNFPVLRCIIFALGTMDF
jgi:hypothetical protein